MIGQLLSGTVTPDQWLVDWVRGGPKTSSGETITESNALTIAAVWAAVRVLAETVASLPLNVHQQLPSGQTTLAIDSPVQRLIHDQPNEDATSFIFRETAQGHLGTWGNAYAEIERAMDDTPVALWGLSPRPHDTKPVRRRDVDNKIWYLVREVGLEDRWVKSRDMLHIPGFGFDGLIGYSPIRMMREPIGVGKAMERYAGELFANDARPNGVVTVLGKMGDDQYNRTKEAFNEDKAQHGNRHRIQVLEGGATFAATQMNPEDVQMIEARRFSIEEIARAYRIAPTLLQDLTHGTYSNITELGRQFIVYTMMPWLKRWEAEINRKLLPPGQFAKFNTRAFLEGDPKQQSEYFKSLFMVGGMTVNRMLELLNENTIGPDGDVRFVPANMIPLDKAIEGPPAKPEQKGPAGFDPNDGQDTEEKQSKRHKALMNCIAAEGDFRLAGIDSLKEGIAERHVELLNAVQDTSEAQSNRDDDFLDRWTKAQQTYLTQWQDGVALWHAKALEGDVQRCHAVGIRAWEMATTSLLIKESKAAVRQAGQGGNFLAWMDDFYDKHAALCVERFEVASLALGIPASDLSESHVTQSMTSLLVACACKADELVDSITNCTARWGDKRELFTVEDKEHTHAENHAN